MDPFLQLVDERKLKAINSDAPKRISVYGSKEDNDSALTFLSDIKVHDNRSKEYIASEVVMSLKLISNVS